ncbi:uncharacterized protein LOC115122068 [Oncorhynchus nerka]|uniref:uncharacterized protein LOC115122068 n=1 Tax=Oncorhynchus nerka TaxID=8023 RepID=UPI0031B8491B
MKLFETTIEELRAERSRIKKENKDLKSRRRSHEITKRWTGESERQNHRPSQSATRIGKCDIGVQCCEALPRAGEQHLREEDQGTELHCGVYDEEGNPQMAFVLIKQEVDWEADYSDDYSPGYILLKKKGAGPDSGPQTTSQRVTRQGPGPTWSRQGPDQPLHPGKASHHPVYLRSRSGRLPGRSRHPGGPPGTQPIPAQDQRVYQ